MSDALFWLAVVLIFSAALIRLLRAAAAERSGPAAGLTALLFLGLGALLCAEAGLRIYQRVRRGVPLLVGTNSFADQRLGWIGRREFGAADATRRRILFVGDSFTDGMEVPARSAYYRLLADDFGAEAFAYGGRGYGTLQELMVIDRYVDRLHPDLIVLQVCSNDILNNSWELERRSYQQNMAMTRPYLENGRVVYRYPRRLASLRSLLIDHSRVFHLIFIRLETLLLHLAKRGWLHTIEQDIADPGRRPPAFRTAAAVTDQLVRRIRERAGAIPVVAFAADEVEPYSTELRRIFEANGVPLINEVPPAERREAAAGRSPYLADGTHWNEHGHRVAAAALAAAFRGPLRGAVGPLHHPEGPSGPS